MAEHVLKTDPHVFQKSWDGLKNFEIRYNDRNYQVGDVLRLRETRYSGEEMKQGKPLEYTDRVLTVEVKYALDGGYGLADGWCILDVSE